MLKSMCRLLARRMSSKAGTTDSYLENIIKKKSVIDKLPRNDIYEEATRKSFNEYTRHTLLMEHIAPDDEPSLSGVLEATEEFDKLSFEQIRVEDLCKVHKSLMFRSKPKVAGKIRTVQVVIFHPPKEGETRQKVSVAPTASEVSKYLPQVIDKINDSASEHPVIHALLCKLFFVHLHPFEDGNGRTSRIILNGLLRRESYPYVVIPVEEREEYFDAIAHFRESDGDSEPFQLYGLKCIDRSLDNFLGYLK